MTQKPNIWIFPIEPLDSRYTGQWHKSIPESLNKLTSEFNIHQIDGVQKATEVTKGAFLNFADTNYWKSTQLINFLELHNSGMTTPNDRFLITDFWNPIVCQLKYISDLTNLNWQFHGVAHAGSYDPQDFLGRLIQDKRWVKNLEKSFYHAYHHLYFATDFHIDLFINGVFGDEYDKQYKLIKSGQPHSSLVQELSKFANMEKRPLILFPHRVAPEKQPEIFRDLAKSMPQYEWVVCQDNKLSKDEYHKLLGESKIVFSANLQETLGISSMESILTNTIPLLPDRLSYSEMYSDDFLYDSEWTTDYDSYIKYKPKLMSKITNMIDNYESYLPSINKQRERLISDYLLGDIMFSQLVK